MNQFYKQLIFIVLGVAIITAGALGIRAVNNRGAAPVGWWKFDEGYGQTLYDAGTGGNDGTLASSTDPNGSDPTWKNEPSCKIGKCLSFDGVDDYVSQGTLLDTVPSALSVAFWMRPGITYDSSLAENDYIFSKENVSFQDRMKANFVAGDGRFDIWTEEGNNGVKNLYTTTNSWAAGTWYHIGFTWDTTNGKRVYVNGILENSDATATTLMGNGTASDFFLGSSNGPNLYFNGNIDDVRIYDYARTAKQIKADYVASAGGRGGGVVVKSAQESLAQSEGLIAHWTFDETALNACGTAQDACDDSGGGNHLAAIADASPTSTAKYGYAATFDGTGDYYCSDPDDDGVCEDDDDLEISNNFTIALWMKADNTSQSNTYMMGKFQADFEWGILYEYVNDTVEFYSTGHSGSAPRTGSQITVDDTNWHHIVYSYDGNIWSGYKDGEQVFSTPRTFSIASNTGYLAIGASRDGVAYYNGQIDDVKIYSVARSASQIRKDYETGPPPVAHWKFDENTGDSAQDTSGTNTGTLGSGAGADSADPTWTTGKFGSALLFDGTNDYVDITSETGLSFSSGNSFSYFSWIKTSDSATRSIIVGDWNAGGPSISLEINSDASSGLLRVYLSDGTNIKDYIGGTNVIDGIWRYIGFTYDGLSQTLKIYVNGIPESLTKITDNTLSSSLDNVGTLKIGKDNRASSHFLDGKIDDVRIYNYARTQKQIMQDMNAGHPAVGSPVGSYVGYWKFDEGFGQTVYDQSINNNNGTLASTTAVAGADPTWTQAGKFGGALSFDGVDDYVEVTDNSSLVFSDMTIAVWIKTSSASMQYIVHQYDSGSQYGLWINNGILDSLFEGLDSGDNGGVTSGSATFNDGAWHHIILVRDTSAVKLRMYADGVLVNEVDDVTDGNINPTGVMEIGCEADANRGKYFDGLIDEVKIYPFALTPEEIKQEYNSGATLKLGSLSAPPTGGAGSGTSTDSASIAYCVPGSTDQCDPPVAHWKFDERSGSTLYDISTSQNTGSLNLDSSPATSSAWKSAGQCHSGSCLSFDGVDDYVDITDDSSLDFGSGSFSYSFWAKYNYNPSDINGIAISKWTYDTCNQGFWVWFKDDDTITVNMGEILADGCDGVAPNYSISNISSWNYYVVVADRNSNTQKVYINGILQSTASDISAIGSVNTDYALTFGNDKDHSTIRSFNGLIDDVRIYNYARTPAQIAWDYNRGAPIAHWTMDSIGYAANSSSTIYDSGGGLLVSNTNDGTFVGEIMNNGTTTASTLPTWKPARSCKYGACLDFDGGDYVDMGNTSFLTNTEGTIALWFKLDSLLNRSALFATGYTGGENDYMALQFFETNNNILFQQRNDADTTDQLQTPSSSISAGTWHHLVFASDGSTYTAYIDGVAQALSVDTGSNSGDWFGDITTPSVDVATIGAGNQGGTMYNYHNGLIDEVRIYNTALTATQVQALYLNNDRSAGASLEDNLVAEWRFDEGAGATMADTHYQRYGKFNYAMEFDGTDDYVSVAHDAKLDPNLGKFTVGAWIYPNSLGNDHHIIVHKGTGLGNTNPHWRLTIRGLDGDLLEMAFTENDGTGGYIGARSSSAILVNQWTHVVGVADLVANTVDFYINGVKSPTSYQAQTLVASSYTSDALTIGSSEGSASFFDGQIDDVRIYNYALTPTQIRTLFNQNSAVRFGPSSGLP